MLISLLVSASQNANSKKDMFLLRQVLVFPLEHFKLRINWKHVESLIEELIKMKNV